MLRKYISLKYTFSPFSNVTLSVVVKLRNWMVVIGKYVLNHILIKLSKVVCEIKCSRNFSLSFCSYHVQIIESGDVCEIKCSRNFFHSFCSYHDHCQLGYNLLKWPKLVFSYTHAFFVPNTSSSSFEIKKF